MLITGKRRYAAVEFWTRVYKQGLGLISACEALGFFAFYLSVGCHFREILNDTIYDYGGKWGPSDLRERGIRDC